MKIIMIESRTRNGEKVEIELIIPDDAPLGPDTIEKLKNLFSDFDSVDHLLDAGQTYES